MSEEKTPWYKNREKYHTEIETDPQRDADDAAKKVREEGGITQVGGPVQKGVRIVRKP